jgi:hypothetical protein
MVIPVCVTGPVISLGSVRALFKERFLTIISIGKVLILDISNEL